MRHLLLLCLLSGMVLSACEQVPKQEPNRWEQYYRDNDASYYPPLPDAYGGIDNDEEYFPPYRDELLYLNDDM